ncbi:MAG: M23 family metallopeptidase [Nocardioidaceae bacterium]|nr:M23 family metallopeptidase [Nocardioidaceae bacterium]
MAVTRTLLTGALMATLLCPVAPGVALQVRDMAAETTSAAWVEPGSSVTRRFWVRDKHRYTSPWYAGAHRKMIAFGCTRAPYYPPSSRCSRDRGFHHGLDLAMPCGTRLFAGMGGVVLRPSAPGSLGSAYGRKAFRIRNHRHQVDIVIGHVRRVYVAPGERVRRGQLIARASDAAAPDGCHLHFEIRPAGGSYTDAVRPTDYLRLQRSKVN